ncbi:MAG TPA: hypothetical protein VGP93_16330, partial [Polyangiaceae bacterium]|nr:hypothetical protein [Polyangiaceae bacterium]
MNGMMRATLLLSVSTLLAAGSCLAAKHGTTPGTEATPIEKKPVVARTEPPPADKLMLWDGDKNTTGKPWSDCSKKDAGCKAVIEPGASAGRVGGGLKFHVQGPDWAGFGWNWHGFWPENAGTDISGYKSLSFWIRVDAKDTAKAPDPANLKVSIASSSKKDSAEVGIAEYADNLLDGQWHEVVVPLSEFFKDKGKDFDPKAAWEFRVGTWASSPKDFDVYIDEIGFDNRRKEAWTSLPEQRQAKGLGSEAGDVELKVDLAGAGKAISPYIYGVSFGDQEMLREMGVTTRRIGGNENSPYDWHTGFTSLGHDWYFENRKSPETPHPAQNRWAIAFP